jgi:hypothetical protein
MQIFPDKFILHMVTKINFVVRKFGCLRLHLIGLLVAVNL